MSIRKVSRDRNDRTRVYIPAYLRDKYNIMKGSLVEVTDGGNSIVITPIKEP